MEQAVQDLQGRLGAMEQELLQQRGANATLQSQLAAAQPRALRNAVDTRGLGKPETFEGTVGKWRDWKVVMRSYTAACHDKLGVLMDRAENTENPMLNATLQNAGEKEASEQLAFVLVMVCRAAALDQVVNAGAGEGLSAWRSLCRRFEPNVRSRFAGILMGILSFDFSGDVIARVEAFEREVAQYERTSGEDVSDGIRVGVVLQRLEDSPLKQHLLMNSERLARWTDFRSELVCVRRAQQVLSASAQPMDVGALDSGKGKGSRGGKGKGKGSSADPAKKITCHQCGRQGHMKKDCWYAAGGKGGKGGKDSKSPDARHQKGSRDVKSVKCFKCGKTGHYARDCRSQLAAVDAPPADDPEIASLFVTALDIPREIQGCLDMVEKSAVRPLGGRSGRRLTVGVDSGAARTVLPKSQFVDYPLEPNEMSASGGCYRTAGGARIPDLGTRRLVGNVGGARMGLRASAADVTKALASVADMVDNGYSVVFSKDRSFAINRQRPEGEQIIEFTRRDRVYEFDMEVEPHSGGRSDFHRQATVL